MNGWKRLQPCAHFTQNYQKHLRPNDKARNNESRELGLKFNYCGYALTSFYLYPKQNLENFHSFVMKRNFWLPLPSPFGDFFVTCLGRGYNQVLQIPFQSISTFHIFKYIFSGFYDPNNWKNYRGSNHLIFSNHLKHLFRI